MNCCTSGVAIFETVVARWNPSERVNRGGLKTRDASEIFGS